MTSDDEIFTEINLHEIDFLTMGNPPSSPLYFHMEIFPIAGIPECPFDVSASDKGNAQPSLPPVPQVPIGGSVVATSVTDGKTRPLCPRPPSLRLMEKSEKSGTTYPLPLPPVRQLPIGGSVGDKDKDERRPLISNPPAKKKKRGSGPRLSRSKQADAAKRCKANARRQLPSETVESGATLWYSMDGADCDGMSAVSQDKINGF